MVGYLYYHLSPSGKYYIGQTFRKSVELRWRDGLSSYQHNKYLIAAIKKYGWENFKHEVIFKLESDDKEYIQDRLNQLEIEYIEKFNSLVPNGYNIHTGGRNLCERMHSPECRAKISKALKGRDRGPEFGKKISEALKGNQNAKGHVLTEESKEKARKTRKNNGTDKWTDKHHETVRKKQEAGELHWTLSEEAKANISNGRKGIIFSEEHRKHISEAQKGKPKPSSRYKHTKEQAQKAWETRRANGRDNTHNKGKIAINNGTKVKYISIDSDLPEGWQIGGLSMNHIKKFDKSWINDGQYAYFILNSELENYLSKGYILGKKGFKTKK